MKLILNAQEEQKKERKDVWRNKMTKQTSIVQKWLLQKQ